jgi:hypothetical protein
LKIIGTNLNIDYKPQKNAKEGGENKIPEKQPKSSEESNKKEIT